MVDGFYILLSRLETWVLFRNCLKETLFLFLEKENMVSLIYFMLLPGERIVRFLGLFFILWSPRFSTNKGGEMEEQIEEISSVFKWEMINRVVHVTTRGGNLEILKDLLSEFWPNVRSKYVKIKSYNFLILQIKNILYCIFLFLQI